jgi:hypothetical protein
VDECKPLAAGRPKKSKEEKDKESHPGEAVQVDSIKLKLKLPGSKSLKLKCDILLSTLAFKFKLRRYTLERGVRENPASRGRCSAKTAGSRSTST